MFETPYQTTPCSRFALEKTTSGIRKLEINEQLVAPETTPAGILFVPPGVIDFPPFLQPMTKKEIPTLTADIVLDGRSLLRSDGSRNKLDAFGHAVLTAQLTRMWIDEQTDYKRDLLNVSDFPAKVFINWISSAVSLRLGLDFGQVAILRSLTAIYYIQLFGALTNPEDLQEVDRILTRAARYLPGVDSGTLQRVAGEIPTLNTIADFIAWVHRVIDSPRIEQLTVAVLYTGLGFSWGPAYREAVAVALEYPPIFLALVYSSTIERSYSTTGLGKTIQRTAQRNADKDYVKNLKHLIDHKG